MARESGNVRLVDGVVKGRKPTICGRSRESFPIVLKTRSCSLLTVAKRSSPRAAIAAMLQSDSPVSRRYSIFEIQTGGTPSFRHVVVTLAVWNSAETGRGAKASEANSRGLLEATVKNANDEVDEARCLCRAQGESRSRYSGQVFRSD